MLLLLILVPILSFTEATARPERSDGAGGKDRE